MDEVHFPRSRGGRSSDLLIFPVFKSRETSRRQDASHRLPPGLATNAPRETCSLLRWPWHQGQMLTKGEDRGAFQTARAHAPPRGPVTERGENEPVPELARLRDDPAAEGLRVRRHTTRAPGTTSSSEHSPPRAARGRAFPPLPWTLQGRARASASRRPRDVRRRAPAAPLRGHPRAKCRHCRATATMDGTQLHTTL